MRQRLFNHFITLCFLFAATSGSEASDGPRLLHQAKYKGEYEGLGVDMTRSLVYLGGKHYRLEAKAENFLGSVKEHEDFLWQEDGRIQPLAYRYKQRIFGISRSRSIDFDWDKGVALCREKNKTHPVTVSPGILGPMSFQLQLQLDLINNATVFDYQFVRRRKMKHYIFVQEEKGPLNQGKTHITNGVKLVRMQEDGNRSTTIWFDADKHFTLAALTQEKDDAEHSLLVTDSHFNYPLTGTAFEGLVPRASAQAKR